MTAAIIYAFASAIFLGAGVVPALASLIVGAPSLRLKGLYLAITDRKSVV